VSLNLFSCGLGAEGGRLLAEEVCSNPRLLALQLCPADGIASADLARMLAAVASNRGGLQAAEQAVVAAAASVKQAALAAEEAALASAQAEAEAAWGLAQMTFRAEQRTTLEFAKFKAEEMAKYERKRAELERQQKMLDDANKKEAKKKGGKK
jgi:hypothetical protein